MLTHAVAGKIVEIRERKRQRLMRHMFNYRADEALKTFDRWVWDRYGFSYGTIYFYWHPDPRKCCIDMLTENGHRCGPALANPVGFVYNYDRTFVSAKE